MEKYTIVKKRIDEMDYFSLLSCGAPDDEFDTESREICEKITLNHTENDIAHIIAEVFNRGFGRSDTIEIFMECAKKIYDDLKDYRINIIQNLKDNDYITIFLFGKETEVDVISTGDNRFDEDGDYKEEGFELSTEEIACLSWFLENINISDYKKEIVAYCNE